MNQSKKSGQRKVVLEQLRANADDNVFDLLADILSIEREHRDHRYGVKEAIKNAIDRVAESDASDGAEDVNEVTK